MPKSKLRKAHFDVAPYKCCYLVRSFSVGLFRFISCASSSSSVFIWLILPCTFVFLSISVFLFSFHVCSSVTKNHTSFHHQHHHENDILHDTCINSVSPQHPSSQCLFVVPPGPGGIWTVIIVIIINRQHHPLLIT